MSHYVLPVLVQKLKMGVECEDKEEVKAGGYGVHPGDLINNNLGPRAS